MDKERIEILTDRFINNEMSPEERTAFCQEIEKEETLQTFVGLRKLVIEGELIAAEQKVRRVMEQSMSSRYKQIYKWTAAACFFVLVTGLGILGHSYKYDISYVYKTYSFIPVIERTRGEGGLKGEIADLNEEIITSYEENRFGNIIHSFRNASPDVIKQLPIHTYLYIAISLMKTNQAQEAIDILSHLPDCGYEEEIDWLLLCGYLQTGAREATITIARKIIEEKGYYSSNAVQILNLINERRWF